VLCLVGPAVSGASFSTATNFPAGTTPHSIAVGKLNGDGFADLAVANSGSSNVSVLLGTGTGSFGTATNFPTNSSPNLSIAIGSFNADGYADLAVVSGGVVSVLLGTGTGAFGAATSLSAGAGPASVATGNLNGDGFADLAVANYLGNDVSVLPGTGTGSFGTATDLTVGSGPYSVATGNLNGDSLGDLAVANSLSDDVSVLLNTSVVPKARISRLTVRGPKRVRRGRPCVYRARITNAGTARATGVRLVASGKGIRLNVPVGRINPRSTRTVRLRIRPSKAGRIKATFKAVSTNAGSRTVRKTITVR
jgi:hypothetical protein